MLEGEEKKVKGKKKKRFLITSLEQWEKNNVREREREKEVRGKGISECIVSIFFFCFLFFFQYSRM